MLSASTSFGNNDASAANGQVLDPVDTFTFSLPPSMAPSHQLHRLALCEHEQRQAPVRGSVGESRRQRLQARSAPALRQHREHYELHAKDPQRSKMCFEALRGVNKRTRLNRLLPLR